jgi:hypothetical protein
MDFDVLEKLLNHLERCQVENKSLQINIDEDLLKIFPLPRKLILDLLSEPFISMLFRLSDDQNILFYQNNVNYDLNLMRNEFFSVFLASFMFRRSKSR